MSYDDATWQDTEDDIATASVAIGVYMAWAARCGLANPDALAGADEEGNEVDALPQLQVRTITPAELASTFLDYKLTEDMFNDEGNAFTTAYYEATYLEDLGELLESGLDDTWATFDRVSAVLDRRLAAWRGAA